MIDRSLALGTVRTQMRDEDSDMRSRMRANAPPRPKNPRNLKGRKRFLKRAFDAVGVPGTFAATPDYTRASFVSMAPVFLDHVTGYACAGIMYEMPKRQDHQTHVNDLFVIDQHLLQRMMQRTGQTDTLKMAQRVARECFGPMWMLMSHEYGADRATQFRVAACDGLIHARFEDDEGLMRMVTYIHESTLTDTQRAHYDSLPRIDCRHGLVLSDRDQQARVFEASRMKNTRRV